MSTDELASRAIRFSPRSSSRSHYFMMYNKLTTSETLRGSRPLLRRGEDVGEHILFVLSKVLLGEVTERVGIRLVGLAEE